MYQLPGNIQGSYPFSETNFQDFSRAQIDFSRALKFLPYTSYFFVEFNRFPELSRTSGLFQAFPGLEKDIIKFQDFPGFPGPVPTLNIPKLTLELFDDFYNIKHTDYIFLHILTCTGNNMLQP